MMKSSFLAVFMFVMLLESASFGQKKSPFDTWDKNRDGRLTKDELPPNARPNFEKADANSDGFVSRDEDSAYRRRGANRDKQPRQRQANANIDVKLNLAYAGTDNPRQKLDLFLPKKRATDKPLPMIAFIHGGGWRNGDKRGGLRRVAALVETGEFAGASIGYRLTGEASWPAQIHDCKAAIRWLRAHAEEFGFDPNRIAVMGSSAGGHLVAMLGTSGDVKKLEGNLGKHKKISSRVNCVIDEFGPTNFLKMNDFPGTMNHLSADSPESKLLGQQITKVPELVREASPITYVTKDDPPILIIHGSNDPLVPYQQSVIFTEALKEAGVQVTLQQIKNGEHGGFNSEEVNTRTRLFLEKHLLGRNVDISAEPITVEPRRRK
jgi:acetyl esterase/lipase